MMQIPVLVTEFFSVFLCSPMEMKICIEIIPPLVDTKDFRHGHFIYVVHFHANNRGYQNNRSYHYNSQTKLMVTLTTLNFRL